MVDIKPDDYLVDCTEKTKFGAYYIIKIPGMGPYGQVHWLVGCKINEKFYGVSCYHRKSDAKTAILSGRVEADIEESFKNYSTVYNYLKEYNNELQSKTNNL